ncbi:MAG TPA: MBL fold metallo-hydrolase [Bacteroidia bacterium]|nr:MBL fold metallo-hydrolase [Bacteroidia bacterium]
MLKIYGKLPKGERLERIKSSPNFKNGVFQNLSHTPTMAEGTNFFKVLVDFINKPKDAVPAFSLPAVKTDLKIIASDKPVIVWFGHSSYFIRINNKNILVDPVLSGNAAPFSFMVKAFKGVDIYTVDDFPEIDYLILTHDHYDHLDYKTIIKLKNKVKTVCCSLGTGAHLEYWGYDGTLINEFDWWDTKTFGDTTFTAAPARHFSGRGLKRAQSLWVSFILKTGGYSLYLGGDSGYGTHFKEIGSKYGPFDIALLETGQYNTSWPYIHMMPEETVQAGIDLGAKVIMPVHWGKFSLALHGWTEPVERFIKKADELNVKYTTPMIGEPVILDESYPVKQWWKRATP